MEKYIAVLHLPKTKGCFEKLKKRNQRGLPIRNSYVCTYIKPARRMISVYT